MFPNVVYQQYKVHFYDLQNQENINVLLFLHHFRSATQIPSEIFKKAQHTKPKITII